MRPSPGLLPILIFVLMLGHVCDVAALVELPDAHHAPEGHSDEEALACDGVGLLPAGVPGLRLSTIAVATVEAITVSAAIDARFPPHSDSSPPAPRPRLFLLFASFLI